MNAHISETSYSVPKTVCWVPTQPYFSFLSDPTRARLFQVLDTSVPVIIGLLSSDLEGQFERSARMPAATCDGLHFSQGALDQCIWVVKGSLNGSAEEVFWDLFTLPHLSGFIHSLGRSVLDSSQS